MTQLGLAPAWWCCDFEFLRNDGNLSTPVCMVAVEARSGRELRLWTNELLACREAPFPVGSGQVFVAYLAAAEFSCFKALGWRLPVHVFDCYVEFCRLMNGTKPPAGLGLLGALAAFNLPSITDDEKDAWRQRVMAGPPYNDAERTGILDYCASDVYALVRLLPHLLNHLES